MTHFHWLRREGDPYRQGFNFGWVRGPLLVLFFTDEHGNGLKVRWRWRWKFWNYWKIKQSSTVFNWAIQCGTCERGQRPHKLVVPGG